MSSAPDIAGLYVALRRLPDRTPEQRQAYRVAGSAHRASSAMQAGRRWRHERLVRAERTRLQAQAQPRDPRTGRFVKAE